MLHICTDMYLYLYMLCRYFGAILENLEQIRSSARNNLLLRNQGIQLSAAFASVSPKAAL